MKLLVSEAVDAYAENHTREVAPLFKTLREETFAKMRSPQMQVGRVEGTLLKLLVQLSNAKRVLELGMFTGYSALMMAEGLPDDGELFTCDIDPKALEVAQKFFAQSPHGKKIRPLMGPALETIPTLKGSFDLVFIDADKENYPAYYELVLPRVRSGGLIVADNVLWSGAVADPKDMDAETEALRKYSHIVTQDPRVDNVLLTVRDGMMLARKK